MGLTSSGLWSEEQVNAQKVLAAEPSCSGTGEQFVQPLRFLEHSHTLGNVSASL